MMDFSNIGSLGISLGTVTELGFYILLGVYAIFTAIFYYHWQTYGTDVRVTGLTLILYFLTTVPLLLVMGIMVLII